LLEVTHLKEAIRLRDEFLWLASHELKTPLTPLQLQLQGFIRMLEISDAQVGRLSRLIGQFLDVSRISDGKLKLNREPTNLKNVIQDV